MQNLVAYLIVTIAVVYAAWLFMPQAARRWLVTRIALVAPPSQRSRLARLQSKTESAGCSTCKGCETDATAVPAVKPIRLHRH